MLKNYSYALNPNTVNVDGMILHEGTILKRKFIAGTEDEYECRLLFLTVKKESEEDLEETKPFAVRVNNPNWIMEFIPEEYEL
ncbi:MAG: hypothetical protein ACRCXZ_08055 [Patescibacteria group bacterium]